MADPVTKAVGAASAVTMITTAPYWTSVIADWSPAILGAAGGAALAVSAMPVAVGAYWLWWLVRVVGGFSLNVTAALLFTRVLTPPIGSFLAARLPPDGQIEPAYLMAAVAGLVAFFGRPALALALKYGPRWVERKTEGTS